MGDRVMESIGTASGSREFGWFQPANGDVALSVAGLAREQKAIGGERGREYYRQSRTGPRNGADPADRTPILSHIEVREDRHSSSGCQHSRGRTHRPYSIRNENATLSMGWRGYCAQIGRRGRGVPGDRPR
jgi:hypothetical protein